MYIPVTDIDGELTYVDAKFEFVVEEGEVKDIKSYEVEAELLLESELIDWLKENMSDFSVSSADELKEFLKERFGVYQACCPRVVKHIECCKGVIV